MCLHLQYYQATIRSRFPPALLFARSASLAPSFIQATHVITDDTALPVRHRPIQPLQVWQFDHLHRVRFCRLTIEDDAQARQRRWKQITIFPLGLHGHDVRQNRAGLARLLLHPNER